MWIDLVTADDALTASVKACITNSDYLIVRPSPAPFTHTYLQTIPGLLIFDTRGRSAAECETFKKALLQYPGFTFLVTDTIDTWNTWMKSLPTSCRVDSLLPRTPRTALAFQLRLVRESLAAQTRSIAQNEQAGRDDGRLEHFRSISEHAPFILLSLSIGREVAYANASARSFFSQDIDSYSETQLLQHVHQDDRDGLSRHILRALNDFERFDLSVRALRADRTWRWLHIAGGPQWDAHQQLIGVALSSVDVTDWKEGVEALQQRESRLRELADTLPVKVWRSDATLYADYFNKVWEEYTGLAAHQINDQEWVALTHPDDLQPLVAMWKRAVKSPRQISYAFRLREKRSGLFKWHRVHALPTKDSKGNVCHWYGATIDIDDAKKETETISRLYKKLLEINRIKDRFLLALSAEIRPPIMEILRQVAFLASRPHLSPEDREAFAAMFRNTEALLQQVEDLLDMSQMVTGHMALEKKEADVAAIVRTAIEGARPAFDKAGVFLDHDETPDLGRASVDPRRYGQIVTHLLSNALKFTPRGGRVCLHLNREGGELVLLVMDTGRGMSETFLPLVFEPFAQEEPYLTRKQGGLGLGLAIVRHIATLHGGTITATSQGLGKGSRFEVRVPFNENGNP